MDSLFAVHSGYFSHLQVNLISMSGCVVVWPRAVLNSWISRIVIEHSLKLIEHSKLCEGGSLTSLVDQLHVPCTVYGAVLKRDKNLIF